MNKTVKIILSIILSFSLLTGCSCSKKEETIIENENKLKVNTNENVVKDQTLEVFTFTNTSLVYEDGTSLFETTVTNTSNENQFLKQFNIYVRDEQGNIIVTFKGFIGDSIEANSSKIITSSYALDLTNATSIDYEIVR